MANTRHNKDGYRRNPHQCALSLHERHRKYVWSDINTCSPPVAVTAGIAGANLISQGEVSLVV